MRSRKMKTILLLVAALACILAYNMNLASARPLSNSLSSSTSSIVARLKLDKESSGCWDSLIQLQACTGEIILFFLNGETYLGHGCCNAIRTITQQCWPNLIDTLGFTAEEGDVLEGYCDKATTPPPPAAVGSSSSITRVTMNNDFFGCCHQMSY